MDFHKKKIVRKIGHLAYTKCFSIHFIGLPKQAVGKYSLQLSVNLNVGRINF